MSLFSGEIPTASIENQRVPSGIRMNESKTKLHLV